jgi:hypothetical protein
MKAWLRAPFFSPAGFLVRAASLAAVYGLLHLFGLRDYATVLSGGLPAADSSPSLAAFLGLAYVLAYFGWVIAVPVLVLASGVLAALERRFR